MWLIALALEAATDPLDDGVVVVVVLVCVELGPVGGGNSVKLVLVSDDNFSDRVFDEVSVRMVTIDVVDVVDSVVEVICV